MAADTPDDCCGPLTDPASKDCTLPSSVNLHLTGTQPKVVSMDKAIEARYGKPNTSPESFSPVPGTNFAGPGTAR